MKKKTSLGILVSGSGSNLQAIIDNIEAGRLDAEIAIVISNVADAYALERCRRHGLPCTVIDHRRFSTREDFDRQLITELNLRGVELVIMAGFMRILSPQFLAAFPMRIMNIHPALLPSFPGLHVQKKAVEYGVRFSGCTVHFADGGVDTGPIIIQAVVPVHDTDDENTLAARILREEHRIYSQAIQWYAEGRLEIRGRRVFLRDVVPAEIPAQHNPPLSGR
ncbi:MAG: phosphoribosylglycinamide formyltransferase [Syntrophobacterales bacterium]|nr:phosphoribosylglycinamide formyltransferase [Syntrophobacterales bacterium]